VQLALDETVVQSLTSKGNWQVSLSGLTDDIYAVTATATDVAGNVSAVSVPLQVTLDTTVPQITLTTATTTPLGLGSRLTGTANGTGSNIVTLSYRFDNQTDIIVPINELGAFDQPFNFTGISNGAHTLTLTAIDAAGNVISTPFTVTVDLDTSAPLITVNLLRDTAPGNTTNSDRITSDPTITGIILDANPVVSVVASFNNTTFTNITSTR
jgi:Bacterial Ig-like domain